MNTAGTSNEQIVTGLQNSASAMASMGSTLEENIALFTAAQEITQDASKVGNALRTISMRIRGYDEETSQLSEDLVNIKGEVVDLTKVASNNFKGISLFTDETQTEYKSIYQYLQEISQIYNELGAKDQQALLEKLFGKNRASVGAALIQNFGAAEKAMTNMANSAGSAEQEMETITESLEYKMNVLKETATGVFQNLIDRGDLGNIVDGLTKIAEAFDFLTDKIGLLGTVAIGGSIFGIVKLIQNFGNSNEFALYGCESIVAETLKSLESLNNTTLKRSPNGQTHNVAEKQKKVKVAMAMGV